jgi:hypothetical protein
MRPVDGITRTTASATSWRGRATRVAGDGAPAEGGRALIPLAPLAASEPAPAVSRRPSASFLAQLIATQQQAPQTRERRRADPDVVVAHYQATAAGSPADPRFVRSC